MKIYLVGGAVRDRLLGEVVRERDFVVVGGTPDVLLKRGYQQVGRDFPVFLHPETQEEYALARTERKSGPGYRGFACDFNANVTLEEDLARRDLTINAIAQDESGHLIDPYHGARDLKAKKLRHVSPAFIEDPVRVLRLARFAARFHHLGFTVAEETRALVSDMIRRGELLHLVPERVWQEWEKSLNTKNPAVFIEVLKNLGALQQVFPEFDGMKLDMMLTKLSEVARRSDDPKVRFAAFMLGLEDRHQIERLTKRLHLPNAYKDLAAHAVSLCDVVDKVLNDNANDIVCILEQMDAFRKHERFLDLLTVCEKRTIVQEKWKCALSACRAVDIAALVAKGYQGEAMKKALHQSRVAAVRAILYEK